MSLSRPELSPELRTIQATFQYLGMLLRREAYVHWLCDQKQLQRKYPLTELYNSLCRETQQCTSLMELFTAFRVFKQKHFLRIGGRDCLGWAGLEETMSQLSDLAGVCLQVGLDVLGERSAWWTAEEDTFDLKSSPVTILGLGKLGGAELNYVSDVDLVFLGTGHTGQPRSESWQRKLLQTLTSLLSDQVDGDRVFKVDLRLRPQGKDGDLVPSLEAAVDHYLVRGRAWERQALLKARTMAGSRELGASFVKDVRPFIFRRFLDFQALDELRTMRDRILEQARQQGQAGNFDVKLGLGGIREVEFVVQSFQLIYGGRYRELDEPNTLRCLDKLRQAGLMAETVKAELRQGYMFLRRVEHWIQLDRNRQHHKLPTSKTDLQRLAGFMGFESDVQALQGRLSAHCQKISSHFESLFSREKQGGYERTGPGKEEWSGKSEARMATLRPRIAPELFQGFSQGVQDALVAELQRVAGTHGKPLLPKAKTRVETFLRRIKTRPGLVRLFYSLPAWLPGLSKGIVCSQLIADLLTNQPGLIEGLPQEEAELKFAFWKERAASILADCPDYEQAVEWIRRLKNERMLALAVAELTGTLAADQVELELSRLADYVLQETYRVVCLRVMGTVDVPLAVLALGKLGSFELSYLSDLDLMYVYDPGSGEDRNRIPVNVIKCIQRLMRMLSTPLQEGPGYEVDSRLRPTGNYGPLAVTRRRWESYYAHEADIWEVQSLLRLRPVAGDTELGQGLVRSVQKTMTRFKKPEEIWSRLCALRLRMELERGKESGELINLKLGFGGVADIEFLLQGHQLITGHTLGRDQPAPLIAMLDHPQPALQLSQDRRARLKKIVALYQTIDHCCQLYAKQSAVGLGPELFQELTLLGFQALEDSWEDILGMRREVRAIWNTVCTKYQAP